MSKKFKSFMRDIDGIRGEQLQYPNFVDSAGLFTVYYGVAVVESVLKIVEQFSVAIFQEFKLLPSILSSRTQLEMVELIFNQPARIQVTSLFRWDGQKCLLELNYYKFNNFEIAEHFCRNTTLDINCPNYITKAVNIFRFVLEKGNHECTFETST